MNEQKLRSLIDEVKGGKMSRREFIRTLGAFGLAAPLASQLLTWSGVAQA